MPLLLHLTCPPTPPSHFARPHSEPSRKLCAAGANGAPAHIAYASLPQQVPTLPPSPQPQLPLPWLAILLSQPPLALRLSERHCRRHACARLVAVPPPVVPSIPACHAGPSASSGHIALTAPSAARCAAGAQRRRPHSNLRSRAG